MNKFLYFFFVCVLFSCSEDESSTMSEEQMETEEEQMLTLPNATQEGLGTFGCLVDNDIFSEDDDAFNTLYVETNGGLFITGAFNPNGPVRQVVLGANQNILEEGVTYVLGVAGTGGYYGEVLFFGNDTPTTTAADAGSMTITKLDPENNIVSGTFSFDIMNPQGELIEIRSGRFDQIYDN